DEAAHEGELPRAQLVPTPQDRLADHRRVRVPLHEPRIEQKGVVVADDAHAFAIGEAAQHLPRPRPERRGVTQAHELIDPLPIHLVEHRAEREVVAVEVRNQSDAHRTTMLARWPAPRTVTGVRSKRMPSEPFPDEAAWRRERM